jgi:type VI secretion system protein ImpK
MAPLSRWKLIFLVGTLALLALSELLWLWPTWQLRQVMDGGSSTVMESKP